MVAIYSDTRDVRASTELAAGRCMKAWGMSSAHRLDAERLCPEQPARDEDALDTAIAGMAAGGVRPLAIADHLQLSSIYVRARLHAMAQHADKMRRHPLAPGPRAEPGQALRTMFSAWSITR